MPDAVRAEPAVTLRLGRGLAVAALAAAGVSWESLSPLAGCLVLAAVGVRALGQLLARRDLRIAPPRASLAPAMSLALIAASAAATIALYAPGFDRGYFHFKGDELVDYDAMNHVALERNMAPLGWDTVPTTLREHPNRLLPFLTYALDRLDPPAVHAVNLALWIVVAAAIGAVTLRLTASPAAATLTTVLVALTPSQAGTVLWVHGREDLLATVFILAGLALYATALVREEDGTVRARRGPYGASVGAMVLAVLCKETAIVLPALAFGVDALVGGLRGPSVWRRRFVRIAPFVVLAAAQLYAALFVFEFQTGELAKGSASLVWFALTQQLPMWFFRVPDAEAPWTPLALALGAAFALGAWRREASAATAAFLLVAGAIAFAPTHHLVNYPKHILLPSLFTLAAAAVAAVGGARSRWDAARSAIVGAALVVAAAAELRASVADWVDANGRADALIASFDEIRTAEPPGTRFLILRHRQVLHLLQHHYAIFQEDPGFALARVNPDLRVLNWATHGTSYEQASRPLRIDDLALGRGDVLLAVDPSDGRFVRIDAAVRNARRPIAMGSADHASIRALANPAQWRIETADLRRRVDAPLRIRPAPRHTTIVGPELQLDPRTVAALEVGLRLAPRPEPRAAVEKHARAGLPFDGGLWVRWSSDRANPGSGDPYVIAPLVSDGELRWYRFDVDEWPPWLLARTIVGLEIAIDAEHDWIELHGVRAIPSAPGG